MLKSINAENEAFYLDATYKVNKILDKNDDLCKHLEIVVGDKLYFDFRLVKELRKDNCVIDIINLQNNKSLNDIMPSVFSAIIRNVKLEKI